VPWGPRELRTELGCLARPGAQFYAADGRWLGKAITALRLRAFTRAGTGGRSCYAPVFVDPIGRERHRVKGMMRGDIPRVGFRWNYHSGPCAGLSRFPESVVEVCLEPRDLAGVCDPAKARVSAYGRKAYWEGGPCQPDDLLGQPAE
jgi:hypothetical protein